MPVQMTPRTRPDLISLSLGASNIARLRTEAKSEGLTPSALVREWIVSLDEPRRRVITHRDREGRQ